jgi:hypothetical protein
VHDLFDRSVFEVEQHHGDALGGRQLADRPKKICVDRATGDRFVDEPFHGRPFLLALQMTDGHPDCYSTNPCIGSLEPRDLPPVRVQLDERVLRDVFGSLAVMENQEDTARDVGVLGLVEPGVLRVGVGRRLPPTTQSPPTDRVQRKPPSKDASFFHPFTDTEGRRGTFERFYLGFPAIRAKEPVTPTGSPMLVMRKGIGLLAITAAATLLAPGSAAAKGSTLRFEEERYAPGNSAVALVETWLGSGGPKDAPYTVYLVRGEVS